MTIAVNPDTGGAVYLDGDTGQWVPAQIATNPDTGESVAFDGKAWAPVKLPPPPAAPDPFNGLSPPAPNRTLGQRFSDLVSDLRNNPVPKTGPSIIGAVRAGINAITSPIPPAYLGSAGDVDEAGGSPADAMTKRAIDLASTIMVTSAGAAARRGIEPNTLGMNFVPKVPTGAPVVAPVAEKAAESALPEVVQRASDLGISLPRYMVDESRMTQGLAAGLQNIPGAGDKIAKAAGDTVNALGNAVDKVREGYGTGSPAVAGSYAKDALADWMTGGSKKVAERVYDAVDNLVDPGVKSQLPETVQAAQSILARRANAHIPGKSAAVDAILDAATAPGGLNYEGIKGLRSYLGEMTPQEMVTQGINAGEVKQLYGALTSDLKAAVINAGDVPAYDAFLKANRVYDSIVARRDALTKIVGAKGDAAPEAVFSRILAMAGSKSSADINRLALARKTAGPEAWNEVASAVVGRLGRDPQGDFSIQRFLTAYGNLSPGGRSALFKSTGKDNLGKSLEDINFVTKQIEDKLKQFYNPSGTGRSLASSAMVFGVLHHPIQTLSTLIGGNRLATALTEPATAQATADWLKAYSNAITSQHATAPSNVKAAAEKLAGIIARTSPGNINPQILALQLQFAMPARKQAEGNLPKASIDQPQP